MKKFLSCALVVLMLALVGCSNNEVDTDNTLASNTTVSEETEAKSEIPIDKLKQGDEVSIVGQVAGSVLINGNTLWVQVQQPDKTFVIYHCQLKDEHITAGEELKMLDAVKIKGCFLSLMDSEMENTSPLVTLYDCEIIG